MAKAESNHRAYPRFTTGYVDQQGYYRRFVGGRDPLCVGATGWHAGPNQIFVEGGDYRSVAAIQQKVLLVTANGTRKFMRIGALIYDAGGDYTNFVLNQVHGLTDIVDAYLLDSDVARQGWAQLADDVDDDVTQLVADRLALRATFLALKQRVDAVFSDEGAATVVKRPAAEFLPLKLGPLAIAPGSTISAPTDPVFGNSFRITPDPSVALVAAGVMVPLRIRFQTTNGPVLSMVWDWGTGEDGTVHFETGSYAVPAIGTITDVEFSIVREGAGRYTNGHFPDGVIASTKFFPRLAHQSDYEAFLASLNIAGTQARVTAAEDGLTGHASSGLAHGASSRLIGDGGMDDVVARHNESLTAHLGGGGVFAAIQARALRGVANGYVPLGSDGRVPAAYLAGPYGVKRVLHGTISIPGALTQMTLAWAELDADPVDPSKTFVSIVFDTQALSVESSTFATAILGADNKSVVVERAAGGDQVSIAVTLVEFYG